MGITKNKQSNEMIIAMAKKAFPDKTVKEIKELTEGMCNAAYMVSFKDGFKSVLKISSSDKSGFMTNEANLMSTEVKAMKLVNENSNVKVAEVFYYDNSKTLCDSEYFFMEALEGQSWISVIDSLRDEDNADLSCNVGVIQKELSGITGEKFGIVGDADNQFDSLFDFVYYLILNVLTDAGKRDVIIGVPNNEILGKLQADKKYFDTVKIPSLVHWDMWEGNIFVKDNKVSGIIDWERAMWGEPFMDDRFREHSRKEDFLRGFGIEKLSEAEMRRIHWYDILLYLTMMTEATYREYEDDGQYQWAKAMFDKVFSEM